MAQRVTTQQLFEEIRTINETIRDSLNSHDKRLGNIERDVRGSNGEGLWDVLKSLRSEIRTLDSRVDNVEKRIEAHTGVHEGKKVGSDYRHKRISSKRRNVEVYVFGTVLAVLATVQLAEMFIS